MANRHGIFQSFNNLLERAAAPAAGAAANFDTNFGRLFPPVQQQPAQNQLVELGALMKESSATAAPDSNVPLGFVFFGQFVDHDLTLDTVTTLGQAAGDLDKIPNFRTPRLELDSVYLGGPSVSPYLYVKDSGGRFLVGTAANPLDLQRNAEGTAIIGDPRNDENMFIAQLHSLFMRFHNRLMDQLTAGGKSADEAFKEAQSIVRSTYQHIIVHEFLPGIVHANVLQPLVQGFKNGNLPGQINWKNAPSMPVEFSAAAYRFGHSQVREDYVLNSTASGTLFQFGAFTPVPASNNLEWKRFFDLDGTFQKARPIDTKLVASLFALPFASDQPSLAARNMIRGQLTFKLPPGEQVATALGVPVINKHASVNAVGLNTTPLWFYILAEAEQAGGKLGPVGGTLVAGTILNTLLRDPASLRNGPKDIASINMHGVQPTMAGVAKFASA